MEILSVIILGFLAYGFARFMQGFIKELALFVIEAWRDIELEQ